MRNGVPRAVGVFALALVVLAVVVWLYPTHRRTTTVVESSTTRTSGGGKAPSTTRATQTTATTEPGTARSDTIPALLLGTGALLLLVAAFWGRIEEIGLPGGGSIKLTAAEAPAADLDDLTEQLQPTITGPPEQVPAMMTSLSSTIVTKASELDAKGLAVVLVDLGAGDKWVLPNLYFLALVFERWTGVEALVFTKTEGDATGLFVAGAPPRGLRKQLEVVRPEFAAAAQGVGFGPLNQAGAFFQQLEAQRRAPAAGVPPSPQPREWVSAEMLTSLAAAVLRRDSVEVVDEDDISRKERLQIVAFPYRFVPITREQHLLRIIDRTRLVSAGA